MVVVVGNEGEILGGPAEERGSRGGAPKSGARRVFTFRVAPGRYHFWPRPLLAQTVFAPDRLAVSDEGVWPPNREAPKAAS